MRSLGLLLLPVYVFVAGIAYAQNFPDSSGKDDVDLHQLGERIYREGILPSGKQLRGLAQANIVRTGKDAACVACHRRSGFGTSEGSFAIRSIAGTALYGWQTVAPKMPLPTTQQGLAPANPRDAARLERMATRKSRIAAMSGSRQRPPYDDLSLSRAVREGVDVQGSVMNAGMPRYDLADDELKPLLAYLKTLSVQPSPGVSDDEIHFSTVIQPGVDAAKRSAMLNVLNGFLHDKNAGTRSEELRKQAGTERMYRSYRKWVLHVWELTGPAAGWEKQLDAYSAAQPVFAMIGGLGTVSWKPIHEFSERAGIPCIFPEISLPVIDGGYYTVYLSKGVFLEAEALAKYLADKGKQGPVMQVYRRDDATSVAAAQSFQRALSAKTGIQAQDHILEAAQGAANWQPLTGQKTAATLVLWLTAQDIRDAEKPIAAESQAQNIFLSSTLLDGKQQNLASLGDERVHVIYPQDLPLKRDARLLRIKSWLHNKGIASSEEKVLMDTYFAVSLTADVVGHMLDVYSRDFFLERIEHMTGNTVTPSLYPHISLGPDQRFASKGSYIVKPVGEDGKQLKAVSEWIVP